MTGFNSKREAAADKLQEPVHEALKLALDGIEKVPTLTHGLLVKLADVEAVIDKALAQPAQEPERKALKLALEALDSYDYGAARIIIHEALALPAQEPDALTIAYQSGFYDGKKSAQRLWVGLTQEDFSAINQSCLTKLQAATSAESILKERNS